MRDWYGKEIFFHDQDYGEHKPEILKKKFNGREERLERNWVLDDVDDPSRVTILKTSC